jgi:hypothetical protein
MSGCSSSPALISFPVSPHPRCTKTPLCMISWYRKLLLFCLPSSHSLEPQCREVKSTYSSTSTSVSVSPPAELDDELELEFELELAEFETLGGGGGFLPASGAVLFNAVGAAGGGGVSDFFGSAGDVAFPAAFGGGAAPEAEGEGGFVPASAVEFPAALGGAAPEALGGGGFLPASAVEFPAALGGGAVFPPSLVVSFPFPFPV